MRDGIELSTNVFRPANSGRLPTILVRTPYGKGAGITPYYQGLVDRGYAVVIQDVRGRYASGGVFDPLRQESNDGEDTLKWIARQPWSNQRVGMLGGSYLGIAQWKAALVNSPYLKAIFPVVSGSDDYFDRFYSRGGAFKLGQRLEWISENMRDPGARKPDFNLFTLHLPLRTADREAAGKRVGFYQDALDHPAYDAFWNQVSTLQKLDRMRVPVFAVGGWYDNFAESDLEAFRVLQSKHRAARIMIGPWPHNPSFQFPNVDFGPDARVPLRKFQLEWFDYWVKGNGEPARAAAVKGPPVRIFVMGANRWRDEEEWPLRRARPTALYLAPGGGLRRAPPAGEASDGFIYDPANPVPTTGGAVCCNPRYLPWGPLDQRTVEKRRDVLVYTTPPLERPVEVTGAVRAVLWVATSAPDTDFTAKLVDVFPDGYARNLSDGILRLRYRKSLGRPEPARPGEVYRIVIEAGVTSNEFGKGHRIRLEVSSSNFPRFDRNPNTGGPIAAARDLRRATQTVYRGRLRPSHLLLPVVPGAG